MVWLPASVPQIVKLPDFGQLTWITVTLIDDNGSKVHCIKRTDCERGEDCRKNCACNDIHRAWVSYEIHSRWGVLLKNSQKIGKFVPLNEQRSAYLIQYDLCGFPNLNFVVILDLIVKS